MKKYSLLIWFILVLALFNSCRLIGININRKTAIRGDVYPTFSREDSLQGGLNNLRTCYDVQHYALSISINPDKKYICGYVDIDFDVVRPTQKIQIDLYDNMQLDSILYKNEQLLFKREFDAVYISFPDTIIQNSEQSIRCYYQGKPKKAPKPPWKGGFVWKKSKDGKPWIGVACELAGASLWWPCKDHISDEPDEGAIIDITVPKGLQVISNGVLTKQYDDEQTSRFVWETNYPINNYNITLYVGAFEHFSTEYSGTNEDFTIDYYVLPEHKEEAEKIFTQTPQVIQFYEKVFGPYPWSEEGFKLVGSPYAGMEHQTAIAYGTNFKRYTHHLGFDYLIVHEAAHEWWGNAVSAQDYADIFLHEGFATYAEVLYVEHIYGKQAARNYLGFYGMLVKNKNPVVGPRGVNFWDYKDSDPYLKGAWALHGLRNIIGDDLFFDLLRDFYAQYYLQNITVSEFIEYVNEFTHENLTWYFNQYLYDRNVPELQYKFEEINNEEVYVYVKWTEVQKDFALPVRLFVTMNDGTEYPILVYPTTKTQKIIIKSSQIIRFDSNFAYFRIEKNKKLNSQYKR